jgi:hypothetical protein
MRPPRVHAAVPAALVAAIAGAGCDRTPRGESVPATDDVVEFAEIRCDVASPPPEARTVQVVFSCDEHAVGTWRHVTGPGVDTLELAVRELLRGPTIDEREAGLTSFFSAATADMLNAVSLRDGVAHIDFRDFSGIIPNASASAGSTQLLDQLAGTVFQFDGIDEAEITFGGSCDAFWNWLQRGCQRLTRDDD